MKRMVLSRARFLRWLDGDFLDLESGKGIAGDDADHERAESFMEAGGQIIFTDGSGLPISKMEIVDGVYQEMLLE